MLSVRDLSRSYAGRPVLAGVSLDVAAGELVAVMGESGAGKSTLLNLIAGLERPDAGTIHVDGAALTGLSDDARTGLRRRRMGFVFQAFHLLPHLSVADNVGLPLALLGVAAAEADQRVAESLAAVGMAGRAASRPRELSGGEQQRVAIARALVHAPALILADEPTGNLDADNAREVLDLLARQVRERGAAGLLVTHSRAAARAADRVLVLGRDGLRPARDP